MAGEVKGNETGCSVRPELEEVWAAHRPQCYTMWCQCFSPNLAPQSVANFMETLTSSTPAESLVPSTQHSDNTPIGSSRHASSKSTSTHVTDALMVVDGPNKDWETSAGYQGPVKHSLPSGPLSLTNSHTSKRKCSSLDVQSAPFLSLLASSLTSASGLNPTSNSTSALNSKGPAVHVCNCRSKVKGSQLTNSSSPVVMASNHRLHR